MYLMNGGCKRWPALLDTLLSGGFTAFQRAAPLRASLSQQEKRRSLVKCN